MSIGEKKQLTIEELAKIIIDSDSVVALFEYKRRMPEASIKPIFAEALLNGSKNVSLYMARTHDIEELIDAELSVVDEGLTLLLGDLALTDRFVFDLLVDKQYTGFLYLYDDGKVDTFVDYMNLVRSTNVDFENFLTSLLEIIIDRYQLHDSSPEELRESISNGQYTSDLDLLPLLQPFV